MTKKTQMNNRTMAVLAGLAWTVGVAAIGTQADSDPVGAHYDTTNRFLTIALVLLLFFAIRVRRHLPRVGGTALICTAVAWLAGNVLEFWVVLATDQHTEKTAARLGEAESWWGSPVGWMVFMIGFVTVIVAAVALAAAAVSEGVGHGSARAGRIARHGPVGRLTLGGGRRRPRTRPLVDLDLDAGRRSPGQSAGLSGRSALGLSVVRR